MKTKQLVLIGLLIIASVLMIAPVIGADPTAAVAGNPPSTVDLTGNRTAVHFDLNSLSETNTTLGLFAITNCPFTVTVDDSVTGDGKMTNFTTVYQAAALKTQLTDAFGVAGITNATAGVTGAAAGTPITDAKLILTGASATGLKGTPLEMTLSQTNAKYDTRLPTGSVYRIDLVFVITATAT